MLSGDGEPSELSLLRCFHVPAIGLVWVALGLGLLAAAGALVAKSVSAPIAYQRAPFEQRVPLLMAVTIVVCIASLSYFERTTKRELEALRPWLSSEKSAFERAWDAVFDHGPIARWAGLVLGIVAMATVQETNTRRWSRFVSGDWNAFDAWVAPLIMFVGFIMFQYLVSVVAMARGMYRVGREIVDMRLFDRDVGAPFARFGLRSMLVIAVVPALAMGAFQAWTSGVGQTFAAMGLVYLIVGTACLVFPSAGLRARVRDLKVAELRRIDRAINGGRAALAESPWRDQLDRLGLVELLAYRREVSALPEWPLDVPVLARFTLYLVIAPASWIAAALVERLIDAWVSR